ncbi:hypothetical protein IQ230_04275 [Gloeocapsopsis crepidinum LEGE 06123]|uniref:Uncharacterized protein n=1 Tax=Gloeocapsopsis crepidinum LEGE 06123 TaxID=588587 RepID=A0ABR9UQG6_9CHRO|nr:hypothetical protein [Gloeocapsopsis crepidinum]MBE9189593.1 hypothetical protein [Gloeocapsopsis crepidinum LEGE 06123]
MVDFVYLASEFIRKRIHAGGLLSNEVGSLLRIHPCSVEVMRSHKSQFPD